MAGEFDAQPDTARRRIAAPAPVSVASGAFTVIDCGGCAGIVAYPESGGTMSYQPCDRDGTVVTDSSSSNFVAGTVVSPPPWRWLKVSATSADGIVCTV